MAGLQSRAELTDQAERDDPLVQVRDDRRVVVTLVERRRDRGPRSVHHDQKSSMLTTPHVPRRSIPMPANSVDEVEGHPEVELRVGLGGVAAEHVGEPREPVAERVLVDEAGLRGLGDVAVGGDERAQRGQQVGAALVGEQRPELLGDDRADLGDVRRVEQEAQRPEGLARGRRRRRGRAPAARRPRPAR